MHRPRWPSPCLYWINCKPRNNTSKKKHPFGARSNQDRAALRSLPVSYHKLLRYSGSQISHRTNQTTQVFYDVLKCGCLTLHVVRLLDRSNPLPRQRFARTRCRSIHRGRFSLFFCIKGLASRTYLPIQVHILIYRVEHVRVYMRVYKKEYLTSIGIS